METSKKNQDAELLSQLLYQPTEEDDPLSLPRVDEHKEAIIRSVKHYLKEPNENKPILVPIADFVGIKPASAYPKMMDIRKDLIKYYAGIGEQANFFVKEIKDQDKNITGVKIWRIAPKTTTNTNTEG